MGCIVPRKVNPKPDPAMIKARQMRFLHARWKREVMTAEQIADEQELLEIDILTSMYVRELEANDWQMPE